MIEIIKTLQQGFPTTHTKKTLLDISADVSLVGGSDQLRLWEDCTVSWCNVQRSLLLGLGNINIIILDNVHTCIV